MAPEEKVAALTPLDVNVAEVVRISRNREKRATAFVVAGIVWSFTYTAISLLIMFGVATQTSTTCEQLSDSREAVRALIITNPAYDAGDIDLLDTLLPPIVCD